MKSAAIIYGLLWATNGFAVDVPAGVQIVSIARPQTPKAVEVEAPTVEPQPWPNYPLRSSWWSGCGSWRHLASGEHAGKFDPDWLAQLSHAEVQSLHSDDHERRVRWEFTVRPKPTAKIPTVKGPAASGCPGGVCPRGGSQRPRIIDRLFN